VFLISHLLFVFIQKAQVCHLSALFSVVHPNGEDLPWLNFLPEAHRPRSLCAENVKPFQPEVSGLFIYYY